MSHQHTMEIRAVIDCLKRRPMPPRTAERAIILIMRLDGEIEHLYKSLNMTAREQYINGRNDGIKEFVEKLKDKVDEPSQIEGAVIDLIIDDIDNLVKEMTEKNDGTIL